MPNRIVREGIVTSERVDLLSFQAEVLYRRLMSVVDDYGRFDGRPGIIRSTCFPLRLASVREADISRWISECENSGLVALYRVQGKPHLELKDFRQPIRAKSKWPAPPWDTDGSIARGLSGTDGATSAHNLKANDFNCAQSTDTDAHTKAQSNPDPQRNLFEPHPPYPPHPRPPNAAERARSMILADLTQAKGGGGETRGSG